ncbi:MAG: ABC transporter substrate-binding protein [Candidatus Kapaibacterium sp.]
MTKDFYKNSVCLNISKLFIAMTLLLVISSCSEDKPTDKSKITLKIGALLPLTGSGSSAGESMLAALEVATEAIKNSEENEVEIELHTLDTETSPQKALAQLETFKSMGISFVVGPYSSAELDFIRSYADDNDILLISPSSGSISLAIADDNVIRLTTNDFHQADAISKYFDKIKLSKVCAVIRDDVWGNSLYDAVNEAGKSTGFEFNSQIKYSTSIQDYTQIVGEVENKVTELVNSSNDVSEVAVYMATFNEGTDILAASSGKEFSEKVSWIGTSAYALNSTLLADDAAFDFAVKTNLICPVYQPDDAYQNVLAPVESQIKAKIGRVPESYAYTTFDSFIVAASSANAVRLNPGLSPKEAAMLFCSTNTGITGALELDEYGDRKDGVYNFWQVRKTNNVNEWYVSYKYNTKTGLLEEVQ